MTKSTILSKSELPNTLGRPTNAPNTLAISVDLDRPQSTSDGNLHKPFKIKVLGHQPIFPERALRGDSHGVILGF